MYISTSNSGSAEIRRFSDKTQALLEVQLESFKKQFGRYPAAGEPVFFDPSADTPQPIDGSAIMDALTNAMLANGTRPELVYAYGKCGFFVSEGNKDYLPKDRLAEWNAAVDEYFELENATKRAQPC